MWNCTNDSAGEGATLEERASQTEEVEATRGGRGFLQRAAPGGLGVRLTHDLIGASSHRLSLAEQLLRLT